MSSDVSECSILSEPSVNPTILYLDTPWSLPYLSCQKCPRSQDCQKPSMYHCHFWMNKIVSGVSKVSEWSQILTVHYHNRVVSVISGVSKPSNMSSNPTFNFYLWIAFGVSGMSKMSELSYISTIHYYNGIANVISWVSEFSGLSSNPHVYFLFLDSYRSLRTVRNVRNVTYFQRMLP